MDLKSHHGSFNNKSTISAKSKHGVRPAPVDFDTFFPNTCFELGVLVQIVVQKVVMADYASQIPEKTKGKKRGLKKKDIFMSTMVAAEKRESKIASVIATSERMFQAIEEDAVCIDAVYDTTQRLIKLKFNRSKEIPREIMTILSLLIPYYPHLESLAVNEGLNVEGLYDISKFIPTSNITEVILDNAYFPEANYHILLDSNCLKHLSLARCKLDDIVLKTISKKLEAPNIASKSLYALNLSSNFITDYGAKYIAYMLRTNRTLAYLNLSGNMITDKGAISILSTLDEFPLTEQESKNRKVRFMDFMIRKMDLVKNTVKELKEREEMMKERVIKRKGKPATTFAPTSKGKSKADKDPKSIEEMLREQARVMVDRIFGPFVDPFSPEYIKFRDRQTYCYGNNTLNYLNLAYNHLSYLSVKRLQEVLMKQQELDRKPKGLVNVNLEGNNLPIVCDEYFYIDNVLMAGLYQDTKVVEKTKRKSISHKKSDTAISQPPTTPTDV